MTQNRNLPITERIKDDDGNDHTYEVILFGALDGLDLLNDVLEVAGEPLGAVLNAFSAGEALSAKSDGVGLSDLLNGSLDGPALGRALSSFSRAIAAKGGSKLTARILHNTLRDGRALSSQVEFESAYRGNYGELGRALLFSLRANYGKALKILGNPTSPAIEGTRG